MPKFLIDGTRKIIDHVPGNTDRASWAALLTANTAWRTLTVTEYPPSFHVGHYLSLLGDSAEATNDTHNETKIQARRHKVQLWADEIANNNAVYREVAFGNTMATVMLEYRIMMLSAAKTDGNLSYDVKWALIDDGLVGFRTFMGYRSEPWVASSVRTAMRNGTTFYKFREYADSEDHSIMHIGPLADTSITMTSVSVEDRLGL